MVLEFLCCVLGLWAGHIVWALTGRTAAAAAKLAMADSMAAEAVGLHRQAEWWVRKARRNAVAAAGAAVASGAVTFGVTAGAVKILT